MKAIAVLLMVVGIAEQVLRLWAVTFGNADARGHGVRCRTTFVGVEDEGFTKHVEQSLGDQCCPGVQ